MATTFIDTDTIVASGTAFALPDIGDDAFVLEGVTVASGNGHGILGSANGNRVVVAGFVAGNGGGFNSGVRLDDAADSGFQTIIVTRTGTVYGEQGWGAIITDRSGSITIDGYAFGNQAGAAVFGGDGAITVSGRVEGPNAAVVLGGDRDSFVNTGEIFSEGEAVRFNGEFTSGVNHGSIISTNVFGSRHTVLIGNSGSSSSTFHNYGSIAALSVGDTPPAGFEDYAIWGGFGRQLIYNAGEIIGDVALNGGDDLFDARGGTVSGTVYGGTGDDTYVLDATPISIVELAGEGSDTIETVVSMSLPTNFEILRLIGQADLTGTGNAAVNRLEGNASHNLLRGLGGNDTILGNDGDDTLDGGLGNDRLIGGNGEDLLIGGRGNDSFDGGAGIDTIDFGLDEGAFAVVVNFSGSTRYGVASGQARDAHRDTDTLTSIEMVKGGAAGDKLVGGTASETLFGGDGDDAILGDEGADVIDGGAGHDRLIGWRGADIITGGAGDDTLLGDFDDDILSGGTGNDRLQGGAGRDLFVFEANWGEDRILDYNTTLEKLDFTGHSGVESLADLTVTSVAGSAVITDAGGNRLVLVGVDIATISVGDFLF